MNPKHKITIRAEVLYLLALLLISFSVAMVASADLGVSMVVAPAYILSLKIPFLTFGQCEYILQGLLFLLFCFLMGGFRLRYLGAFVTCLIYGAMLDGWRMLIPMFNPAVTEPGSMGWPLRIIFFALGAVLTSLAVAMFFKTYLPPQVVDFFVKGVAGHYRLNRTKFKTICDFSLLGIALALSLIFFRGIRGIGVGTIIVTALNGTLIGMFVKLLDRYFEFPPLWPKAAEKFGIE